ncbi:MAG TPA: IPT/TIG domain-containing protein [Longimicrobiales bacterium]|nr:IPT/TIG domain-containing protein [Longimicrobiales bacterium]
MGRLKLFWVGAVLVGAGCDVTDPPTPDRDRYTNLSIVSGNFQIAGPGTALTEPIIIRLEDRILQAPVRGREVTFRVPAGSGLEVTPTRALTDSSGMATATVKLGTNLGRYVIDVDFAGNPGWPTGITVEAALDPVITSVQPAVVSANDEIMVTGENFGPLREWNEVWIDNMRAFIITATTTQIRVRVPKCMPTRAAGVTVRRGTLRSGSQPLQVSGINVGDLTLSRGGFLTLSTTDQLSCVQLAPQSTSATYLVVAQNAAEEGRPSSPFQLVGLSDTRNTQQALAARPQLSLPEAVSAQLAWDARLRRLEADLLPGIALPRPPQPEITARVRIPEIGDQRGFQILTPQGTFSTVTAVVRLVSSKVIVYVDPAAGNEVSMADLGALVSSFQDVILPTSTAVFGDASDLDQNGRAIIIMTPAVNRLTPAGSTSFIAGFFFACDLLNHTECMQTNNGEILYTMVPDPTGQFGLKHSRDNVLKLLPNILGHELQHLIAFNQRVLRAGARTPEALWLSEALAHSAEDTLAGAFRARGLEAEAAAMERGNQLRAAGFLAAPDQTSLVATTGDGSLNERGAGWLFMKYLQARYGQSVITKLIRSTATGTQNVVAATNTSWTTVLRDWATALYAANAPELNGVSLSPTLSFGSFNPRAAIGSVAGGSYPLVPQRPNITDFAFDMALPASASSYLMVTAAAGEQLNLAFAGLRGAAFGADARPQIAILRVQ